jgi:hypothetical protein
VQQPCASAGAHDKIKIDLDVGLQTLSLLCLTKANVAVPTGCSSSAEVVELADTPSLLIALITVYKSLIISLIGFPPITS